MTQILSLSDEDRERVRAAVHAAESQTSGEIVTVVTRQSDDYADVALWWSAGIALLALIALTLGLTWSATMLRSSPGLEGVNGGWLIAVASVTPSEIGTSILTPPPLKARQALEKKGRPA